MQKEEKNKGGRAAEEVVDVTQRVAVEGSEKRKLDVSGSADHIHSQQV